MWLQIDNSKTVNAFNVGGLTYPPTHAVMSIQRGQPNCSLSLSSHAPPTHLPLA